MTSFYSDHNLMMILLQASYLY